MEINKITINPAQISEKNTDRKTDMTRSEIAAELFKSGYNCAQSVCGAFSKDVKIEKSELLKLSSAFGGGFGRKRELCGAVSAMGIILGLLFSNDKNDKLSKEKQYKLIRKATDEFERRNETIICGKLLKNIPSLTSTPVPAERNELYYSQRPCIKFVIDATEIIENII